jgi:hypothetical protein
MKTNRALRKTASRPLFAISALVLSLSTINSQLSPLRRGFGVASNALLSLSAFSFQLSAFA